MRVFYSKSNMVTSFSTTSGIDEEFSSPHAFLTIKPPLLTVDIRVTQILVDSFMELFLAKSYEKGYNVALNPVAFPRNWRWTYIMNSKQVVPPPNCKVYFTIHPRFTIRTYCDRF